MNAARAQCEAPIPYLGPARAREIESYIEMAGSAALATVRAQNQALQHQNQAQQDQNQAQQDQIQALQDQQQDQIQALQDQLQDQIQALQDQIQALQDQLANLESPVKRRKRSPTNMVGLPGSSTALPYTCCLL